MTARIVLLVLASIVALGPIATAHGGEYEDWYGHPGPPQDCAPGFLLFPTWVYVCRDHGCPVSMEYYVVTGDDDIDGKNNRPSSTC